MCLRQQQALQLFLHLVLHHQQQVSLSHKQEKFCNSMIKSNFFFVNHLKLLVISNIIINFADDRYAALADLDHALRQQNMKTMGMHKIIFCINFYVTCFFVSTYAYARGCLQIHLSLQ